MSALKDITVAYERVTSYRKKKRIDREGEDLFLQWIEMTKTKSKWNQIKMLCEPSIFSSATEPKYSSVEAKSFYFPDFVICTCPQLDTKFLYLYQN